MENTTVNGNDSLHNAKREKNDEFYTKYADIEKELAHYLPYLKGKRIICPCDTENSEFVKYFNEKGKEIGILSFAWSHISTGTDFRDVDYSNYDVVITNPPFSLFREFIATLEENNMDYLVGVDGKIIRELTKDELKDYFKKSGEVSGVPALRKMGVEEERIKEYIDKIKALGMSYKNFEASSILYMVASVNGEKIVYINENLIQNVRGINIEPAEFTKIAKERYDIDFATIQECIAMSKNPINETIERVKRLF